MEEARQYSAVKQQRAVSLALYGASIVAFVLGIVGQIVFRGYWLQAGITAFPFFRFVAWSLTIPDAARLGRKQKRLVIANALLWLFLTVVIGLSVNAILIWGR